jgi:hypothetical protein
MTASATCAHELCRCEKPYSKQNLALSTRRVDPDAEFCSDRCAEMTAHPTTADGCECGHPECTPQATPDIPPMQ